MPSYLVPGKAAPTAPNNRRGFLPAFVAKYSFNLDRTAYATKQRRPKPGEVDYFAGLGGYPLNYDAGEHFMRLRTGIDYFPFPPRIGAMQEFMPQVDMLIYHDMYRKAPSGPTIDFIQGMAGVPVPLANLQWQLVVPGFNKTA